MMRTIGMLGVMSLLVGCGGPSESKTPTTGGNGTIRPQTQAQVQVGHYKTTDGVYGLVFDRSGDTAKMKVDGEKDIVELTRREDRVSMSGQGPSGSLRGYVYVTPSNKPALYVGTDGWVTFFHGDDELSLLSDADAEPLGAPTVKGRAVEAPQPKSETENLREALGAHAIRTKQKGMTSEDASDPAKVAAAIAAADADSFYSFVASDTHHGHYVPLAKHENDLFYTSGKPIDSNSALGKYNAKLFPILEFTDDKTDLKIAGVQVMRPSAPPADKTPGVLWEVANNIVFVTLDGGRYELPIGKDAPIRAGLVPVSQWPAALQDAALGPPSIEHLAAMGLVTKDVAADVKTAQDEWHNCAKGEASKLKPALEAVNRENTSWSTKSARRKEAAEKWETATIAKCAAKQTKMESLLVTQIEARNKQRLATLEKAKARVQTLKIAQ